MTGRTLLSVDSAAFGYVGKGRPIVSDVTLRVSSADFVLLRGANGCGKSTIVKGVLGLARTLGGSVSWGIDRTKIGYVPQESSLPDYLPYTALDVVKCGISSSWGRSTHLAVTTLAQVELSGRRHARFGDLSGGQKRRVLLARALAAQPEVILLDEPTANVDVHSEQIIAQVIETLIRDRAVGVLAVSHSVSFGAGARVVRVENGRAYE